MRILWSDRGLPEGMKGRCLLLCGGHSVTTECELLSNVKADMYKFHVPYKSLNSVAALSWATSSIL